MADLFASLRRFVPRDGGAVARSLTRTEDGWVVSEPCALNTAEMAKAAFLMDAHGVPHPLDAAALLDRLVEQHLASADYQTVALALWAASLGRSPQVPWLWSRLREAMPSDASQSMPLAWTLSALCALHTVCAARECLGARADDVERMARTVHDRLVANQDDGSGLFYASARREGLLRRRVADTTLSSQTYPIVALTSYARTFDVREALARAARCGDRLSALQGPRGQWWWRYRRPCAAPYASHIRCYA